jgi:hypothetical protein
LRKTARQDRVNRGVRAAPPVQLDEHCRRDSHRDVPLVRAAERSPHELVTPHSLARACEHRQCLAVEN